MTTRAGETTTFGMALRRFRLASGLSQEGLAERARLSVDAIRALERGRRNVPRAETVRVLASALALDPADRSAFVAFATEGRTALPASEPAAPGVAPSTAPAPHTRIWPVLPPVSPPVVPGSLIGREREEAAVTHLLRHAGARLLTLTGPGGVGKTRLALAVAAALRASYPDGSVFVDLSTLRHEDLVLPAIAHALGMREASGRDPGVALGAYLRPRSLLLVLDNMEQVVEAALPVAELVALAPGLTVLVTSRVALRVRAEQQFRVRPLATPEQVWPRLEELANCAAVRLFVERAQAVQPGFQLDEANAQAVAEICRRLDGLPLALELAAARVGVLPPVAMLGRLERQHRLAILKGGARDLPERQQALRATIDWGYGLLSGDEQALFRRLSVFAGGCAIEAAEAVCDPDGTLRIEVLEGLAALVDHSLLRLEGDSAPADEGAQRFGMLETLREYGLERLEASAEAQAVRRAHALYYLALAEAAEPELYAPAKEIWLARLEREYDNLRAALDWACTHNVADVGLRLGAALARFWLIHGRLDEGHEWLQRLLLLDGAAAPTEARALALNGAAWLAHALDDFEGAHRLFEESVAMRRALGQSEGVTDLLVNSALQRRAEGAYTQAQALLEESLALHRAMGDVGDGQSIGRGGLGLSLARLALICCEQGDYARAATLYEECLALHRALGDRGGIAAALLGLGDVARDRGEAETARLRCEESLALFHALGERWGIGFALNNLALLAYWDNDLDRALALAEESVAYLRQLGWGSSHAEGLATLGCVVGARGDTARAQTLLFESMTLGLHDGPRWLVAAGLEGLAQLDVASGQAERAAELCGAAAGLRAAMGAPLPPSRRRDHERTVARARQALDSSAFDAAWARGQALPPHKAIALAAQGSSP